MLRFLVRAVGLLLVAAGFVGLVVDATGSIANSQVSFTSLGQFGLTLFPASFPRWEPTVSQVHPYLWNPIALNLLQLPASIIGFGLGALLLWLGRRPVEPIGYQADT
jgi:hypothetical protein